MQVTVYAANERFPYFIRVWTRAADAEEMCLAVVRNLIAEHMRKKVMVFLAPKRCDTKDLLYGVVFYCWDERSFDFVGPVFRRNPNEDGMDVRGHLANMLALWGIYEIRLWEHSFEWGSKIKSAYTQYVNDVLTQHLHSDLMQTPADNMPFTSIRYYPQGVNLRDNIVRKEGKGA